MHGGFLIAPKSEVRVGRRRQAGLNGTSRFAVLDYARIFDKVCVLGGHRFIHKLAVAGRGREAKEIPAHPVGSFRLDYD